MAKSPFLSKSVQIENKSYFSHTFFLGKSKTVLKKIRDLKHLKPRFEGPFGELQGWESESI